MVGNKFQGELLTKNVALLTPCICSYHVYPFSCHSYHFESPNIQYVPGLSLQEGNF
jgi:hypothetical protein